MTSLLLLALLSANAPKIASPAWNVVDVKPELAGFYAEQLADALRGEGFQVTTASDIATILGAERQRQLMGCAAGDSCMAELANALGCDATLTVNLAKLGNGFRGLAKLMRSSNGKVLSSVRIDASNETELSDKIVAAAKVLAAPLMPESARPVAEVVKPTKVAPKFWWIPGAVGLLGAGATTLLFVNAGGKYDELNKKGDAAKAVELVQSGKDQQLAGWVVGSISGAAILGSLAWLIFGSTDVQPQLVFAPGGALLGVGGSF